MEEIRYWMHSWKKMANNKLYVGVKEKIEEIQEDGTSVWKDNLRIIKEPTRRFYITKPQFRTHAYKKEFEMIDHCDMYICKESELTQRLAAALGKYYSPRTSLRDLCNSPYVYGADVDIETWIKQKYKKRIPVGKVPKISVGSIDIETDISTGEPGTINLITYGQGDKLYTAVHRQWLGKIVNGEWVPATEEELNEVIHKTIGKYLDEEIRDKDGKLLSKPFQLEFQVFDAEVDMIQWIFSHIHRLKPDFVGSWNEFDIPHIIHELEINGYNPADILCHPDVPPELRFVKYVPDTRMTDHFAYTWSMLYVAGYTQFLDFMRLYARLRKVSGTEPSYSLDFISAKELGQTKLHFNAITDHLYLQRHKFMEYTAYNIVDVILLILMYDKNHDPDSLWALCGESTISQFAKQTVLVRNDTLVAGEEYGRIPASAGTDMGSPIDDELLKAGGAVLSPSKAENVTVNVVKGSDIKTQVCKFTNDLDAESMYPSCTSGCNISKESLLSTVIRINGHTKEEVELFFSSILRPDINAVAVCSKFYNLPTYTEMDELYMDYMHTVKDKDGNVVIKLKDAA